MGKIQGAPKTIPFTREGNIGCTFVDCEIADSKWCPNDENAFDVCLKVKAKDSEECDWWRGEMSGRIIEKGNMAGKSQWEATMATLEKLGIKDDVTLIGSLIGKETVAWIRKSESSKGSIYYNVASPVSGGGFEPEGIDTTNLKARMAALMNPQTQAPTFGGNPFATQSAGANVNPFAKK